MRSVEFTDIPSPLVFTKSRMLLKITVVSSVIALSGCKPSQIMRDSGIDPQAVGTAVGVVAGALVGNQIGDGNGRVLATLGGAALGGWLGNQIAASLSKQDQADLNNQAAGALEHARDGETVEWKAVDSNATVRMTPTNTHRTTRQTAMVKLKQVETPPALSLINKPYQADKSANVRSGPGTRYAVVGGMKSGEKFHAVGQVRSSPWIMVAKGGVSVGYIYQPLVSAIAEPVPIVRSSDKSPSPSRLQPQIREAVDLDEISVSELDAVDLDSIEIGGEVVQGDVVAEEVEVEGTCRKMDYAIEDDKQSSQESFEVCEGTDGAWEIS